MDYYYNPNIKFDQDYEIIGTNNYLKDYKKINDCKLDDEKKKYDMLLRDNNIRSGVIKTHNKDGNEKVPSCLCGEQWRYEFDRPLYYKGPIKDISWKPDQFYCTNDRPVEQLKESPNYFDITNDGIDRTDQKILQELKRKYSFNFQKPNNVSSCNETKMFNQATMTDINKFGSAKNNFSLNGEQHKEGKYWHQLSEKNYLRDGDYKLCQATFRNAPFSLENYSVKNNCDKGPQIKNSNFLWNNMTKRRSLF